MIFLFFGRCSTCVERLYGTVSGPCPLCKKTLTRASFFVPVFEDDLEVEREVRLRRQLAAIYNKQQEDFGQDVAAWDAYLEELEDIGRQKNEMKKYFLPVSLKKTFL